MRFRREAGAALRRNPRLKKLVLILVGGEEDTALQRVRQDVDAQSVMSKALVKYEIVPLLGRPFTRQRNATV